MSRSLRLPSLVIGAALAASTGTATAAPYPVAQSYDSNWLGNTLRLRDIAQVNDALQLANRVLEIPGIGRVASLDVYADLHGYVRYWMQPDELKVRGELSAWIGGGLGFARGGGAGYSRWIRLSEEARTYRFVSPDPTQTCIGCKEWNAEVVHEVLDSGQLVWQERLSTSAEETVGFDKVWSVTPLETSYPLDIGILGTVNVSASAYLFAGVNASVHADPGAGAWLDIRNDAKASIDAWGWYWGAPGSAFVSIQIDALPNDGANGNLGDAWGVTTANLRAAVGEVRVNRNDPNDVHFEVCGTAHADLHVRNPFNGWIALSAYATGYGALFPRVDELISTRWNFNPTYDPMPGCQRLLRAP